MRMDWWSFLRKLHCTNVHVRAYPVIWDPWSANHLFSRESVVSWCKPNLTLSCSLSRSWYPIAFIYAGSESSGRYFPCRVIFCLRPWRPRPVNMPSARNRFFHARIRIPNFVTKQNHYTSTTQIHLLGQLTWSPNSTRNITSAIICILQWAKAPTSTAETHGCR